MIIALGLVLRIAGAQGGLWLDEAWSALMAHEVGTPGGVLFGINHDNNHHLNSLWMLAVGMDAPPLAQRALSIASGTAAVPISAMLARKSTAVVLTTALLFAVSPLLVTLGSEARGYSPMLLALLAAMLLIDRSLAEGPAADRPALLAILTLLALLSQLTAVFGIAALAGWAAISCWTREGARAAIGRTVRLFGPALATAAATLAGLALAARASASGFQFGSFERFSLPAWFHAIEEMTGYAVGLPVSTAALPVAALALVVVAPRLGVGRMAFHRLAIVGFPAALALARVANAGHARYYLIAGAALLLMLGEAIGRAIERPGRARLAGGTALAILTAGSLVADIDLARNRRGDPAAAIGALIARAPRGAAVFFDREGGEGVLRVAAAQAQYPLTPEPGCAARFAFVDRFGGEVMPARLLRCGATYMPIAAARTTGMSGTHWTLYERRP